MPTTVGKLLAKMDKKLDQILGKIVTEHRLQMEEVTEGLDDVRVILKRIEKGKRTDDDDDEEQMEDEEGDEAKTYVIRIDGKGKKRQSLYYQGQIAKNKLLIWVTNPTLAQKYDSEDEADQAIDGEIGPGWTSTPGMNNYVRAFHTIEYDTEWDDEDEEE
jgi:hypothetical protein